MSQEEEKRQAGRSGDVRADIAGGRAEPEAPPGVGGLGTLADALEGEEAPECYDVATDVASNEDGTSQRVEE